MRRPRVATLAPRIARLDLRTAPPAAKRADAELLTPEHRAWRAIVLARAGHQCEWIKDDGLRCQRSEATGDRMFADHIVERSDGGAPLDPANGQCLCGHHHKLKTDATRRARYASIGEASSSPHPEQLRPSRVPLTIVCGPPASGKSTLVARRRAPNDLVIDLDIIASRIAATTLHGWDRRVLSAALAERNALLRRLGEEGCPWPAAWFIVGEPKAEWRTWWQERLAPRTIIVCETPESVCLARIAADVEGAARHSDASEAVARWWNEYRPRAGEQRRHPRGF
jgi:hypothetical protein